MSKEPLVIYLRADTNWGKQDYIGGCTHSNIGGIKWLKLRFSELSGYSAEGGTPYFVVISSSRHTCYEHFSETKNRTEGLA